MRRSLYILDHGSYSDYTVDAIVTSAQLAKEAVAAGAAEGYRELFVYDEIPDPIEELKLRCRVAPTGYHYSSGPRWKDLERVEKYWPWTYGYHDVPECVVSQHGLPQYKTSVVLRGPELYVSTGQELLVKGTDFERVRKAYTERKAQAKAAWDDAGV